MLYSTRVSLTLFLLQVVCLDIFSLHHLLHLSHRPVLTTVRADSANLPQGWIISSQQPAALTKAMTRAAELNSATSLKQGKKRKRTKAKSGAKSSKATSPMQITAKKAALALLQLLQNQTLSDVTAGQHNTSLLKAATYGRALSSLLPWSTNTTSKDPKEMLAAIAKHPSAANVTLFDLVAPAKRTKRTVTAGNSSAVVIIADETEEMSGDTDEDGDEAMTPMPFYNNAFFQTCKSSAGSLSLWVAAIYLGELIRRRADTHYGALGRFEKKMTPEFQFPPGPSIYPVTQLNFTDFIPPWPPFNAKDKEQVPGSASDFYSDHVLHRHATIPPLKPAGPLVEEPELEEAEEARMVDSVESIGKMPSLIEEVLPEGTAEDVDSSEEEDLRTQRGQVEQEMPKRRSEEESARRRAHAEEEALRRRAEERQEARQAYVEDAEDEDSEALPGVAPPVRHPSPVMKRRRSIHSRSFRAREAEHRQEQEDPNHSSGTSTAVEMPPASQPRSTAVTYHHNERPAQPSMDADDVPRSERPPPLRVDPSVRVTRPRDSPSIQRGFTPFHPVLPSTTTATPTPASQIRPTTGPNTPADLLHMLRTDITIGQGRRVPLDGASSSGMQGMASSSSSARGAASASQGPRGFGSHRRREQFRQAQSAPVSPLQQRTKPTPPTLAPIDTGAPPVMSEALLYEMMSRHVPFQELALRELAAVVDLTFSPGSSKRGSFDVMTDSVLLVGGPRRLQLAMMLEICEKFGMQCLHVDFARQPLEHEAQLHIKERVPSNHTHVRGQIIMVDHVDDVETRIDQQQMESLFVRLDSALEDRAEKIKAERQLTDRQDKSPLQMYERRYPRLLVYTGMFAGIEDFSGKRTIPTPRGPRMVPKVTRDDLQRFGLTKNSVRHFSRRIVFARLNLEDRIKLLYLPATSVVTSIIGTMANHGVGFHISKAVLEKIVLSAIKIEEEEEDLFTQLVYTGFYMDNTEVTLLGLAQSGKYRRIFIRPDASIVAQVAQPRPNLAHSSIGKRKLAKSPAESPMLFRLTRSEQFDSDGKPQLVPKERIDEKQTPCSMDEVDEAPIINAPYGAPGSIVFLKNQDALGSIGLFEKVGKEMNKLYRKVRPAHS